jgi:hypothetical protein
MEGAKVVCHADFHADLPENGNSFQTPPISQGIPPGFPTPTMSFRNHFSIKLFFSLLLHHFFSSIDIGTAPQTTCTETSDDEHRVTLSFSPSCAYLSCLFKQLPFASMLLFFLEDRMEWQHL